MKLSINAESAEALREFAEAMPLAIENIRESTQQLFNVYQSVAEGIGPHEEEFNQMLVTVQKAQENASDSIQKLPEMLKKTADEIISFIADKPSISGN